MRCIDCREPVKETEGSISCSVCHGKMHYECVMSMLDADFCEECFFKQPPPEAEEEEP